MPQLPMAVRIPRAAFSVLAAVLLTILPFAAGPAYAGGMEIPDNGTAAIQRGGAFTVKADDLTAIAHNPGGLSRLKGTSVLINWDLMWAHKSFTRQATGMPDSTPSDYDFDPLATVENQTPLFPLGPFAAASTDFGLEDFTFALAIYGPHAAGGSKYPKNGGQRYMLTELDAKMLYIAPSMAWGKDGKFGFGVSLQFAMAPKLSMKLVVDGAPNGGLNPYYSAEDVESVIDLQDLFSLSAIVGFWWRVLPNLEVGASSRILPVVIDAEGTAELRRVPGSDFPFLDDDLEITNSYARLKIQLPTTARIGARYFYECNGKELWDIEVDIVYEMWSLMDAYRVEMEGRINLVAGSAADVPDITIAKRWKDTVSVRLGGSYRFLGEHLGASMGMFYESAAVPKNYESMDFMSFDRVGLGLGLMGQIAIGDFMTLDWKVSYSHVFQLDREVDEAYGKVYQVRPLDPCPGACDGGKGWSGVPANAGLFESSYDMLSMGVQANF